MRISETIASLWRRWYVLVAGLLVTGGLGWAVFNYVPTPYESTGSQLLMPPAATVGEGGNPYLFLGGMNEALDVLIRRSNSEESRDPVLKQFPGVDYTVSRDYQTPSPILIIDVSASSESDALQSLKAAMSTVDQNLVAMQEEVDVPGSMIISTRDLVVPDSAIVDSKMAMQTSVLAVGVGLVGTIMVTGFLDGVLTRRRSRGAAEPSGGPISEPAGGERTVAKHRETAEIVDAEDSMMESSTMASHPPSLTDSPPHDQRRDLVYPAR